MSAGPEISEKKFKRHVAFKVSIGEILIGKQILDGERFLFLELGNRKISRVNIVANVIERFDSEGERTYSFVTIDDGSGQIRLKAFGEDSKKLKELHQGDTVIVIGFLRYFNNEIYLSPEIVRKTDPKYLLLRKLELENYNKNKSLGTLEKEKIVAVKDRILEIIKNAEEKGGIETEEIIMSLKDVPPQIINQEIEKFIEEGIVFEPRPGKIRYLG